MKVRYIAGGNPTVHARLVTSTGEIVAHWPAGFEPNEENVTKVVATYLAYGCRTLTRVAVRAAIRELRS